MLSSHTRPTLSLLALALTLGTSTSARAADPVTTALLPVEGAPTLAAELDRSLGRAVAGQGLSGTMGPLELAARLKAKPAIKRALAALDDALAKARKGALFMRRKRAVTAARQAVAQAQAAFARFHQRRKLAEAYEALGQALLLKPSDQAGAKAAFAGAIAADPSFAPPAARMNPTTTKLLRAARSSYQPAPPAPARLEALAQLASVRRVIWLAVVSSGSKRQLMVSTHQRGGGVDRQLRRALPPSDPTQAVAKALGALLAPAKPASAPTRVVVIEKQPASQPAQPTSRRLALTPSPTQPDKPAPRTSKAWYRRWWVWGIIGAVVVGGATATVIAVSSGSDRSGYDFSFRFPQ
jgi:hypothetical protein